MMILAASLERESVGSYRDSSRWVKVSSLKLMWLLQMDR